MPATNPPPFERVAIAGVGLIGGSIALRIRTTWPEVRIVGVDRPSVLAHATGAGAIERGFERLDQIPPADLVVLAAPVRQNVKLLGELARLDSHALITDAGGTKREIVKAASALGVASRFVGGHPIGGAERGGFGFAHQELFTGRPWIFTTDASTALPSRERLEAFVRGLGARPVWLDAAGHDRLMAYVSHLPQLVISALMDTVGAAAQPDGLRLAGRGLHDSTRLASSPADVWREVCSTNADVVAGALDQMIERLSELRADLQRGEAVQAVFDGAARWRAELV
jgi:prephenate dehydrogenase